MKTRLRNLVLSAALVLALVTSSFATHFTYTSTLANAMITVMASTTASTGISGGKVSIYTGSDPGVTNAATGTLLIQWTLPTISSSNCSGGVLTSPSISNVNASATGTAGYGRITDSSGNAVADFDVGTTGTTATLNTTSIVSGGPCSLTLAVTEGQGS